MTTPATLRISRVHFPVTALGPGVRLGIWLQGCPLACAGCMSLDTWDLDGGVEVSVDELTERWREALDAGAEGLTISGGEPLAQPAGLAALLAEVDRVRRQTSEGTAAEYDVLLYTGFELCELDDAQRAAIRFADVLVTGRYKAAAPTRLIWRGSANQVLHVRTELGNRRYADAQELAPRRPPIQVAADAQGFWMVGVPAAGTLPALERALRSHGLDLDRVSWRQRRR